MNMVITSILILAAFSAVYLINYGSIRTENELRLDNAINSTISQSNPGIRGYPNSFFSVTVDGKKNLIEVNSSLDFSFEFYEQAVDISWDQRKGGTASLAERLWMFSYNPLETIDNTLPPNPSNVSLYQASFIDITDSQKTLDILLITLLLVGLVLMVLVFLLSLFYANRSIRPIKEAWEKQERFIADASHELQTPLTIISSNYDVLLSNRNETIESQMKWMERIRFGADRMSLLVNSLLVLARTGNVEKTASSETFDISVLVDEALQAMEALINGKNISLSKVIEQNLTIRSDKEMTMKIISILIENAVKYTNEGGLIEAVLSSEKHHAIFTIKNSGKGLSPKEIQRLFDRFFRGDESRKSVVGFGLGLPIAKALADRLGGKLTASSVENESTTFTFTIKLS